MTGVQLRRRGADAPSVRISRITLDPIGTRVADGMDVPRPQLADALARALGSTTVAEHAVALAATTLLADVVLCESLTRLTVEQRTALRRAESQAIDAAETELAPRTAHRLAPAVVLHGDEWSLVGRSGPALLFVLDAAVGLVIDRSRAEGAAELVDAIGAHLG